MRNDCDVRHALHDRHAWAIRLDCRIAGLSEECGERTGSEPLANQRGRQGGGGPSPAADGRSFPGSSVEACGANDLNGTPVVPEVSALSNRTSGSVCGDNAVASAAHQVGASRADQPDRKAVGR